MSQEGMSKNAFSPERTETIEMAERRVTGLISEIDRLGFSRETVWLKRYLEDNLLENGNIRPTRLAYLEKKTMETYLRVLTEVESRRQIFDRGNTGTSTERGLQNQYRIVFDEGKKHAQVGTSFIFLSRKNPTIWRTSPYGLGYTTTCFSLPAELRGNVLQETKSVTEEGTVSVTNLYRIEYDSEIRLSGGRTARVHMTEYCRDHENGSDAVAEMRFDSVEEADAFGMYLGDVKPPSFEKMFQYALSSDSDSRRLLNWEHISFMKLGYQILHPIFSSHSFSQKTGIRPQSISDAREEFIVGVERDLCLFADSEIQRDSSPRAEGVSKDSDDGSLRHTRVFREAAKVNAERKRVLEWSFVEQLLEGCEEKIIARARKMSSWEV